MRCLACPRGCEVAVKVNRGARRCARGCPRGGLGGCLALGTQLLADGINNMESHYELSKLELVQ